MNRTHTRSRSTTKDATEQVLRVSNTNVEKHRRTESQAKPLRDSEALRENHPLTDMARKCVTPSVDKNARNSTNPSASRETKGASKRSQPLNSNLFRSLNKTSITSPDKLERDRRLNSRTIGGSYTLGDHSTIVSRTEKSSNSIIRKNIKNNIIKDIYIGKNNTASTKK